MDNAQSAIDYALHHFPIVQIVHMLVVIISFPPVIIFISQISKIALHSNCKFVNFDIISEGIAMRIAYYPRCLLLVWSSAFFVCILIHVIYIGCDLATGKYIPESNQDPPARLYIFACHGFAHALSSSQELMLSFERAISCAWPVQYHNSGLAKRTLLIAECLSFLPALAYLWCLSHGDLISASIITSVTDLASLISLSATTYYIVRRNRSLLHSSLNEKYQIKEALDITRVMLPCGVISLVMKFSSTLAAWIYALQLYDSQYLFTITASAYFFLASLNCMICCTLILRRHAGLRRNTEQLFSRRSMRVRDKQTAEDVRNIYFDGLRKDWQ